MSLFFRQAVLILCACVLAMPVLASADPDDLHKAAGRIRWGKGPIRIAISDSLFRENQNIKQGSDIDSAINRSLSVWESVANVKFERVPSDAQNVSPSGRSGDGISLITSAPSAENILFFGKQIMDTPAATRIFFDADGNITESDIVLNPIHQFSTDGTFGTFDLEAVLIHEIGHLLGIEHSPIHGAVMNDAIPRNGLYNLPNSAARVLTDVDTALVRALYGIAGESSDECCGTIDLTLSAAKRKGGPGGTVWAELSATGQVFAVAEAVNPKSFKLNGLPAGRYSLYWTGQTNTRELAGVNYIDEAIVEKNRVTPVKKTIQPVVTDTSLQFIGVNGELSRSPVPVNPGKSHLLYFGGISITPDKVTIGLSSSFLSIDHSTVTQMDYGDRISVVTAEVTVDPKTPHGIYSVFAEDMNGNRSFLIGSIIVTDMAENNKR